MTKGVSFEISNHVAPRYLEPFFLKIKFGEWYSNDQLINLLQEDLNIEGKHLVKYSVDAWNKMGIGETKTEKQKSGRKTYFQILPLGRYLQEIYSTNNELFFDLMHFLFYSAWSRSKKINQARFWVYSQVCKELWLNAPSKMDSFALATKIQYDALAEFPNYYPSISERGIRTGFAWFIKLAPPFLRKLGTKTELTSQRRSYCTPQLFHLAIDLLYTQRTLSYGTSLNVDDEIIKEISITCLLDPERFWEMAERTQMMVKGFELRKSQWGPTVTLGHAPNWIELPEFKNQEYESNDEGD